MVSDTDPVDCKEVVSLVKTVLEKVWMCKHKWKLSEPLFRSRYPVYGFLHCNG